MTATSKVALITGISSNLGINIAYRLLDETDPSANLTIIVTSRTFRKAKESIELIKEYADSKAASRAGIVEFDYLLIDFTDMVSVLSAYYDLNLKYKSIDYVFVNAAQGVYSGIDWVGACKQILRNPVEGVSFPDYKLQRVGVKTADGMGLVFQANVFGPFYLIHRIKPLLKGASVVWISSLMSKPKYLSFDDLQLLRSPDSYEGSKRLVDLMHMGSYRELEKANVNQYVVEPGIFTSFSFFQYLNVFTYYGMLMLFYLARLLGSSHHTISGYKAANAPVSCALSQEPKNVKLGSATSRTGREYLIRHDIDPTGAEDVAAYLNRLCDEWDEKLKDQITDTRQKV
ncbi:3-keto-steroid reductase [Meyerozyma sp. JA9]|nr:3-keto-steroid reductase [Meyerozyma sp. JA9]